MTGPTEADLQLLALIQHVHGLLGQGRHQDAYGALMSGLDLAEAESTDRLTVFAFYRLLGQAARQARQFDDARKAYALAFGIARELEDLNAVSAALEGLGLVELADERLPEADEYLAEAVKAAQASGEADGYRAALQNHAMVLSRRGDPRAVERYEEALAVPGQSAALRAITTDNLADELHRQGRFAESIAKTREAAAMFREAGAGYDEFVALHNLALRARKADAEAATQAFVDAHDLIHRLHADVDVERYTTGHEQMVRRIEQRTAEKFAAEHSDGETTLEIGLFAKTASDATDEGERLLGRHRYADAERLLRQAEAAWDHLGAVHCLPRVWNGLGYLYMETGDHEAAWQYLERAKQYANQLGDARRELIALVNQCSLSRRFEGIPQQQALELLARARGLQAFVRDRQAERLTGVELTEPQREELASIADGGVLDGIAAGLAAEHGAAELEERYLRRFVAAGQRSADDMPGRFASRRARLMHFLFRQGRTDEAAEIATQLEAALAVTPDVALEFVVNTVLGGLAVEDGRWTEETLQRLERACAAHSELRRSAVDVGEAARFGVYVEPPYREAVEVAIDLGHAERAFELVQAAKSRALLDAVRDRPPVVDDPLAAEEEQLWQRLVGLRTRSVGEELSPRERVTRLLAVDKEIEEVRGRLEDVWDQLPPDVRLHRMATPSTGPDVRALLSLRGERTLLEFFTGDKGIYVFTVAAGEIGVRLVVPADDPDLAEFGRLLNDDDPRGLDRLLAQPVYQRLARLVGEVRTDVYVAPHGVLHLASLHLVPREDGGIEPRPGTFVVPSASLLRAVHSGSWARRSTLVIGGDPLGDLPFARAEAAGVAARLGGEARHGGDLTFDWLAGALDGTARLVHLACHAVFDEARPERSGLLLAHPEGGPDRVTLSRLASLDWSGALVVLGSCQSGKHRVRTGDELTGIASTLLAAGATALVSTFRPVPDLATALLMLWFHDRLGADGDGSLEAVSTALTDAQRRVAAASAREVLAWVVDRVAAGELDLALAYTLLSVAHRAAGNVEEFAACRYRRQQLREGSVEEALADVARQRAVGPGYGERPFRAAVNWAPFSITSGG
ncbi:CHAT domain-containing protein [Amycolatopsis mongoliensis]|uniref:CHAT domain-containing protein n=1 Tax=Amycolatopsis mongoliensis TaxID=715475 RepID=A0A9Y2JWC1_9PSEU|nr:CHAT domain-containing protein [Amycolatopsis sp. 4-36]WIY05951.1 CHAT domain-containing protein [Amycolatopsis sp. 4-36]